MLIVVNETLHQRGLSLEEAQAIAQAAGVDIVPTVVINKMGAPWVGPRATQSDPISLPASADQRSDGLDYSRFIVPATQVKALPPQDTEEIFR